MYTPSRLYSFYLVYQSNDDCQNPWCLNNNTKFVLMAVSESNYSQQTYRVLLEWSKIKNRAFL